MRRIGNRYKFCGNKLNRIAVLSTHDSFFLYPSLSLSCFLVDMISSFYFCLYVYTVEYCSRTIRKRIDQKANMLYAYFFRICGCFSSTVEAKKQRAQVVAYTEYKSSFTNKKEK